MSALQESRRELMVQLEGLMKLLKVRASGLPSGLLPRLGPCPSATTRVAPACPVLLEQDERLNASRVLPGAGFQVTLHTGSLISCDSHLS